jgi:hypothetical protein
MAYNISTKPTGFYLQAWEMASFKLHDILGVVMGTTSRDEPFQRGDMIEFAGDLYIVLANFGTRGIVRLLNTDTIFDPFYWKFGMIESRRVDAHEAERMILESYDKGQGKTR